MRKDTPIYIVLSDTGTWLSKTIKRYTKAPYNHVSIALDADLKEMYSFGRRRANNPFDGGFAKEDVIHGTYRKFPDTTCAIYCLFITRKQKSKLKRILTNFEKRSDYYVYNVLGLLCAAMNHPIEIRYAYFCSEFVAELLCKIGVRISSKPFSLITPDDFRKFKPFHLIYEGELYNYKSIAEQVTNSPGFDSKVSIRQDFLKPASVHLRLKITRNPHYSIRESFSKPVRSIARSKSYASNLLFKNK